MISHLCGVKTNFKQVFFSCPIILSSVTPGGLKLSYSACVLAHVSQRPVLHRWLSCRTGTLWVAVLVVVLRSRVYDVTPSSYDQFLGLCTLSLRWLTRQQFLHFPTFCRLRERSHISKIGVRPYLQLAIFIWYPPLKKILGAELNAGPHWQEKAELRSERSTI